MPKVLSNFLLSVQEFHWCGGIRWTPRYFVRRVAWHVLDHTWEIEDRVL